MTYYTQKPRHAGEMVGRQLTFIERMELRLRYAGPLAWLKFFSIGLLRAIWMLPSAVLSVPVATISVAFEWLFDKVVWPLHQRWLQLGDVLLPQKGSPTLIHRASWDCCKDERLLDTLNKMGLLTAAEWREIEKKWGA